MFFVQLFLLITIYIIALFALPMLFGVGSLFFLIK